jgi:CDP-paratose 2-epimerase
MIAAITGGLGSIGTYLVRRLAREGHRTVVYDNLAKAGTRQNQKLLSSLSGIEIRVADCLEVEDYGDVDVIFHLAGDCSAPRSLRHPVRSFRLNAMMTCCVLEAARCQLIPVVYASSVRAYPNAKGQYTIYGLGKWVGDLLCTEYARTFGVPTISNRFGAIYGIYQYGTSESGWLSWFVRAVVGQLPLELHGNGLQQRDCLHNEDVADLLLRQADHLIKTQNCDGKVYDVGGGRSNFVSLIEVLEYLRDEHGYSLEHVIRAPRREADVEGRPATNAEVLRDFGWMPKINIWDGIDELVEAERKQ